MVTVDMCKTVGDALSALRDEMRARDAEVKQCVQSILDEIRISRATEAATAEAYRSVYEKAIAVFGARWPWILVGLAGGEVPEILRFLGNGS